MNVTYDNPAARLLAILEAGKKIDGTKQCRLAWHQLLGTGQDEALLMSRLGKVMELPQQIVLAASEQFPHRSATWAHWSPQVSTAFVQQQLNAQWQSFIGIIDPHTLNYLGMTADMLATRANTRLITDDELSNIRAAVSDVLEEVLAAEIESDVKVYVVRSLRKLGTALEEYTITGALPVLDAVDAAVGHTAIDPSYRDFMTSTPLGDRVASALSVAANVVTIVTGLPQLKAGFNAGRALLGVG